ncbi:conserved hypothetical protein [Ricinus communis]|uniref:Uncharacterized protein n=1 Tax=Ricinus communis TaxID=3988 RepID=B9SW29_RICCO|nr:conserved hypothetical protein [Ricinus communis]
MPPKTCSLLGKEVVESQDTDNTATTVEHGVHVPQVMEQIERQIEERASPQAPHTLDEAVPQLPTGQCCWEYRPNSYEAGLFRQGVPYGTAHGNGFQ